jgi:hypothetical protein
MSKSLRHYKRHGNKTQRRRKGRKARKMTGGNEFDGNNLHEFKELMNQNDRQLVALHSDEECTHCNQFKPEWDKVLDRLPPQPDMTVAKLGPDVTDYMNEHHYRKHNHSVNGVPTIIYYIANNKPQEYDGERTADKIIAWLTQVMAEHNMELTIKPKSQEGELGEEPAPSDLDAPFAPPLDLAAEPMEQEPAQLGQLGQLEPVSQEPLEDAFPQSPLPPASTLSKATETIKATAAKVDEKIEQGVTALKSALTSDLGSLFSSSSETNAATTTPAPALAPPALAPANNHVDVFPPPPPPLVNGSAVAAPLPPPPPSQNLNPNPMNGQTTPSVVGGVRRKFTRRRSKKSKKSKSSRKSRKTKKSNRSKK